MLLILAGCWSSNPYKNLDEFAQCLTDKWAILYGTQTCTYCQKQKTLFGESFAKINFVNCTKEPMKCNVAGVDSIPDRSIGNQRMIGLQSLETLAKQAGCTLQQ